MRSMEEKREYDRQYAKRNQAKRTEYMKNYRKQNEDSIDANRRKSHLKQTYGLSLKDYDTLLANQDGGCAICGTTPEANGRRLDVDHDHADGRVRGLLCMNCNAGLGKFKDSPDLLVEAAKYLYRQ